MCRHKGIEAWIKPLNLAHNGSSRRSSSIGRGGGRNLCYHKKRCEECVNSSPPCLRWCCLHRMPPSGFQGRGNSRCVPWERLRLLGNEWSVEYLMFRTCGRLKIVKKTAMLFVKTFVSRFMFAGGVIPAGVSAAPRLRLRASTARSSTGSVFLLSKKMTCSCSSSLNTWVVMP